ncbi:hypothetical protein RV18_GL002737 [Enterococcus termitis]|nr:hypothetical protein RV18_GL002737 [Enterococcus termitis]
MLNNRSDSSNVASRSGNNLPLKETEYGREAISDGNDTNANEEATRILTEEATSIIIYFSRSGNTENLARMIHNQNGADMLELSVVNPYPADYEASVDRANEERENQEFPEISTDIPDLSQYDTIYLGYQIWAMTLSNPMMSFLLTNGTNLSNKTIYPFSTNAGYGEGDSLTKISELVANAKLAESLSIQDEELLANQEKVAAWMNKN